MHIMDTPNEYIRTAASLEENLKKALTELLVLFLLRQREYYIAELTTEIEQKSDALSIVFPYGVIYRMSRAGYITESKKRIAPDGRLRQFYRITESGTVYLEQLLATYQRFTAGVANILNSGGNSHG